MWWLFLSFLQQGFDRSKTSWSGQLSRDKDGAFHFADALAQHTRDIAEEDEAEDCGARFTQVRRRLDRPIRTAQRDNRITQSRAENYRDPETLVHDSKVQQTRPRIAVGIDSKKSQRRVGLVIGVRLARTSDFSFHAKNRSGTTQKRRQQPGGGLPE